MHINYLSHGEEAQFAELVHSGSDLATLFADFSVQLEVDTDYDTIMISFDDEDTLRIVIEDSPYVVLMDDVQQRITLYMSDYGELEEDGEYDFDEEGIENLVDTIGSRILTRDYDAE